MTNQTPEITIPAASTDHQILDATLELSNRISLRRRLDRLINDPNASIEDIIKLSAVLDRMEARHAAAVRARTRDRELALAELRCTVQLRKLALEEAKIALRKNQADSSTFSSTNYGAEKQPGGGKSVKGAPETTPNHSDTKRSDAIKAARAWIAKEQALDEPSQRTECPASKELSHGFQKG